jgi:hypothetical protein
MRKVHYNTNLFKSQHLNAACLKAIEHLSLCLSAFLIIFTIAVGLVLPDSVTDIRAQSPQSMKDQNIISLNANDAIFNANTTEFLRNVNILSAIYLRLVVFLGLHKPTRSILELVHYQVLYYNGRICQIESCPSCVFLSILTRHKH